MKHFITALIVFSFAVLAFGADAPVSASSWSLTSAGGGRLTLTLTLPDAAHAYSSATGPNLPDGVKPISAPSPTTETDAVTNEPESFYTGPGVHTWILPQTALSDDGVSVRWQVCVGQTCYVPGEASIRLSGGEIVPDAPEASAPAAALDKFVIERSAEGFLAPDQFVGFLAGDASKYAAFSFAGKGFLMMMLLAILGGIALNLTPCVLPLIPVNLAMIGAGRNSDSSRCIRIWHGAAYGAGITITYGVLGVVSVLMGTTFGGIDSSWIFNGAVAIVFVFLGLAMFEIFSLDFSRFGSSIRLPESAHFGGIFLMGALSAVLAGACVAPVLAAALVQTAKMVAHGDYYGLCLPFALGFGMALPWPLAAAGISLFPKPGRWMMRVKQILGILIFCLAAYYAWTAYSLFTDAQAQAEGIASAKSSHGSAAQINRALAESRTTSRPVLLDFTASWCKNCKAMEIRTFPDPAVKAEMQKFIFVQIHADNPSDPETAAVMKAFEVPGLPAYRIIRPAK